MTRPVLDATQARPDPANVPKSRRHFLIWSAVAGGHLAAIAAVWMGGALGVSEASREGGLIMVTLVADVSFSASSATSLAALNAFWSAPGNHGCASTSVLRTPTTCMIGKMPVFL